MLLQITENDLWLPLGRFPHSFADSQKIKAKRMAVQAVHYEKLYKMEQSATDKKQALFSVVEAGLFL